VVIPDVNGRELAAHSPVNAFLSKRLPRLTEGHEPSPAVAKAGLEIPANSRRAEVRRGVRVAVLDDAHVIAGLAGIEVGEG